MRGRAGESARQNVRKRSVEPAPSPEVAPDCRGGVPHGSSPLRPHPPKIQAAGRSAKAREHRSKAEDSRIQAKVFQESAVLKGLRPNPNSFKNATPKPSRIPSPAKRERTGAKRQVRVENAERRALMAAARFVGCPSPSPGAASPRRPLPLRGRGGRRTSQLGSSIALLFSPPLRADRLRLARGLSADALRQQPTRFPACRPKTPPSNPFCGWFDAERGEVNPPQRKRAQAESRCRHVPPHGGRAAGCCVIRSRPPCQPRFFHPGGVASGQPPYAIRLRNMSRTNEG